MLRKIMPGVCIGFGMICLLYFAFLMLRQVDFGWIWAPCGVLLLGLGIYSRYSLRHPECRLLPVQVRTGFGLLMLAAVLIFAAVEAQIFREMLHEPEQGLDYIIVLGAQVKGTRPSRALKKRLEAAREYLEENPETKAVLSGGQGEGEEITEAQCMLEYLLGAGIAPERLLTEDASTTTEENLRFSAACIDADQAEMQNGTAAKMTEVAGREAAADATEAANSGISANATENSGVSTGVLSGICELKIGLLSNNFHVYRARKYAEHMGYSNISTIPAASDWRLQVHYLVREFFALVKGALDGKLKIV